jgi:hypothetical protein
VTPWWHCHGGAIVLFGLRASLGEAEQSASPWSVAGLRLAQLLQEAHQVVGILAGDIEAKEEALGGNLLGQFSRRLRKRA